jgi:hypothetical protein
MSGPHPPPGNVERRPRHESGASKVIAATGIDDTPPGYSRDDPAWLAVERLADAWGPALRSSYRLGFGVGWHRGWLAGRDDERDAWNRIIGAYADTVSMPTRDELDKARTTRGRCNCDQCSACIRRGAIERNRARYGADDYPGQVAS